MRVLMLGWEFPPFITGGLGTACHGLTRALARRDTDVIFVLPRHVEGEVASHVTLVSPQSTWEPGRPIASITGEQAASVVPDAAAATDASDVLIASGLVEPPAPPQAPISGDDTLHAPLERLTILDPAGVSGPYGDGAPGAPPPGVLHGAAASSPAGSLLAGARFLLGVSEGAPFPIQPLARAARAEAAIRGAIPEAAGRVEPALASRGGDYGGDLIGEAHRYARFVVAACGGMRFDVIHAHDWLTYPAGLALASLTGRPLIVHVHSTEFDRSGVHVNQRVYDIERRGMHGALRVVTVSMLTRNLCESRYAVPPAKIDVVYNGVELAPEQVGMEAIQAKDRIVLYFGRITMQKGPEYFVHAAKRVLEVQRDVKFVVAGSGDQAQRMIELAASLGIGHKMLFTGFLRGADIARVFALADLYVMPSVSEPFGIAPLEAMGHDVPVLISRTSGVSEVLTHALKCDFWDVNDMANKIVAVLRHPPLQRTLIEHGRFEVRRLTWDGAAARCEEIYRRAVADVGGRAR